MDALQQRLAARDFATDWAGRGDEKQDAQNFWRALLSKVYGVADPEAAILFEYPIKNDQTGSTIFIDGYIAQTKVLIEQKGKDIDLRKHYKQSDGSMLTPYQQARRYGYLLPHSMNPRWIVVCNFQEFHIHNMNNPNAEPEVVKLADLERECHRLSFLVDTKSENIKRETEISVKAGDLVGLLYDALLKQYKDPTSPATLHSLNALCVRLVFCLYAEDSGIFGKHLMFHDYLSRFTPAQTRKALVELFRVLNQDETQRDPYLADDDPALAAFPYVNGGLFADESIEIPPVTQEIYDLILRKASEDFDWSEISPTIFGAVFESTLNPETRRSGGMHYTSIENIHKVIDPLFLDELRDELAQIRNIPVARTQKKRLEDYHAKLASLRWLDPAAGSGNFLTETYLSVRRLENQVIDLLQGGQIVMGLAKNPIRVSIEQFYGIEINDFAVTVAKTALWIAESQMMKETEEIVHMTLDFLPLKTNAHIVEGNALRMDWREITDGKVDYIMGNPPFVGYSLQSKSQKEDILSIYVDEKGKPYKTAGKIDYVAGWYWKAADLMHGAQTRAALVSTNSITQGEQVASVWKPLYDRFGIHIDFAHRTFRWDSEASIKAHVHCVIVGFSASQNTAPRKIYIDERVEIADNINAYLFDAPDAFIESRSKPLCDIPSMIYGNKPTDGGYLFLSPEEKEEALLKEPWIDKYIKQIYGATEYINGKLRYCLWLVNASPTDIRKSKFISHRVEAVRQFRLNSTKEETRNSANNPTLFQEIRHPDAEYIIIPRHSSQSRRYIPFGFVNPSIIVNDAVQIIPNASLFHFGILMSNIHMSWVRAVCGRIKSDYRYSKDIVYNNFPWPTPTDAQRQRIEKTAQAILDARALYPDASLADLYDELTMPPELRKAHQLNDKAVMEAYGITSKDEAFRSESACVAMLMRMYQELTKEEKNHDR